jgi:hypothetical protein
VRGGFHLRPIKGQNGLVDFRSIISLSILNFKTVLSFTSTSGLVVATEIVLTINPKKIKKMMRNVTNVPKTDAKKYFQKGFMIEKF